MSRARSAMQEKKKISHRRLAHPSWIASMKLMLDLLLGARQKRYLCSRSLHNVPAQVYVPGFSAGSYSGICLLHLLWSMPFVQVGVSWVVLLFLQCYCMAFRRNMGAPFRANIALWIELHWSCENTSVLVSIPVVIE